MSYEHLVNYIIKAVEAVGIAIMVFGGLAALIAFGVAALDPQRRQNSYDQLRRTFGRCILLGLEVLTSPTSSAPWSSTRPSRAS